MPCTLQDLGVINLDFSKSLMIAAEVRPAIIRPTRAGPAAASSPVEEMSGGSPQ